MRLFCAFRPAKNAALRPVFSQGTPRACSARWVALVLAWGVLLSSCASTQSDGRLVSRMAAVKPERWPTPVPVGEVAGLELDPQLLSESEANALLPVCRAALIRGLARPVVQAPPGAAWRVVVSRVEVDVGREPRGAHHTRVRAVAEVRLHDRPAAVTQGVGRVRNPRPTFRLDGVWPEDVRGAVEAACQQAGAQLVAPAQQVEAAVLVRARAELEGPEGGARAQACQVLGAAQEDIDAAQVAAHLNDEDATTRRLCAWAAGELGATGALDALAERAERDAVYAVRVEAVGALNKLLWVDPLLKPHIRAARARHAAAREAEAQEPDPPEEGSEEGESRVLPVE